MNVNCKLVEKTSKNGKAYKCLEITLAPGYVKTVFLDKAEIMLLQLVK